MTSIVSDIKKEKGQVLLADGAMKETLETQLLRHIWILHMEGALKGLLQHAL